MAEPFALDGYDVLAPLGAGDRVWRAVCLADGRPAVLRRWVGAAGRSADVRRRAALWGSLADAGVVAVRDVVVAGSDLVVVSDLAAGGGLDALLARQGSLSAAQLVTLVMPLVSTLSAAHERGLVHGRISAGTVVLDGTGRPMVTDWLPAGEGDAAADWAALVALVLRCLGTVAAQPLAAPSVTAAEPQRIARTASRGLAGAVAVAGLAVALAIGGGTAWGRHDSTAGGATLPLPRPTLSAVPVDWLTVVRRLERLRVQALVDGDRARLASVEMQGSALWRRDAHVLSQLQSMHAHLRGLRVRLNSTDMRGVHPDRVVARVVDAFSSYEVVDDHGVVVARHAAREPTAVRMVLMRSQGSWLISRVSRPRR